MSLSLDNLREDLRIHLGMDSDDLPNVDADRLLNRSWWPLSSQLRFNEKDAIHTFTTVAEQNNYTLPLDNDAIQRVLIQDPDTEAWSPLVKFNDETLIAYEDDASVGIPESYSRRGSEFILLPTPDNAYSIRVKYQKTLEDIQSSGPGIPQEWHEVILWGAVARGFFLLGDWTRGREAQTQQGVYVQSLQTQEERETVDRSHSGLRVLKRRYP